MSEMTRCGSHAGSMVFRARIRSIRGARVAGALPQGTAGGGTVPSPESPPTGTVRFVDGEVNGLFYGYATAADLQADRRHVNVLRHSIGVHLANANWDFARRARLARPARPLFDPRLLPHNKQAVTGLCSALTVLRKGVRSRRSAAVSSHSLSAELLGHVRAIRRPRPTFRPTSEFDRRKRRDNRLMRAGHRQFVPR
jgi:hypothetical protein